MQQQQIYGTLPHSIGQTNASNLASDDELGRLLESSAAVVQEKRQTLEETEKKAVRAALLEERGRFCQFAKFLKPVLVSLLVTNFKILFLLKGILDVFVNILFKHHCLNNIYY